MAAAAALHVIKEGDHVIFDEHGEKKSIHVIVPNGRAKVGKFRIPVGDLIGAPWGSTYKLAVDGSRLIPVTEHEPCMGRSVDEIDKDNATLVDLNQQNQKLKADDIAAMAASGKDGEDIIAALCTNSATFDTKTEFAQEKYKKRKARKYMTQLTLRKPTSWGMCEVMFDKAPTGIWNLRPDSMSLLLSLANVAANSRVLLLENCQGLLVAACAERLSGHGRLCCVGTGGKQPALSGLRQLNLNEAQRSVVCLTQLNELQDAAKRLKDASQRQENGSTQQQQQQQLDSSQPDSAPTKPEQVAADAAADAAPMAVDGQEVKQDSTAGVAVGVEAAAEVPAADVPEDEIMALYDNIQDIDDGNDDAAGATAAKSSRCMQQPNKKQRRGPGPERQHQQQRHSADVASDEAAVPVGQQDSQQQQDEQHVHQQQQEASAGADSSSGSKRGYTATPEQLEQMLQQGFNSCIIAAPRLQPSNILQEVLPLLAPSSPFVIFSPWMQPLAEAMVQLQTSKAAVLLQLQESWLRPYQVLPGRTHPHMSMTTGGTGGYILSGITVATPAASSWEEQGASAEGKGGSGGRGRGGRRGGGGSRRGRGRR